MIDGRGLHLIPGLWDMHVHTLWADDVPEAFLPLFVANGVVGVRDMGGTLPVLERTRAALVRGDYLAPELVVSGVILDGPEPVDPDVSFALETETDGRRAVERLADAGVDFIKVYTLLPEAAFRGVMAAAEEHSLPVAGHVPYEVGPIESARAGMRSVEHTMNEVGGFCPADDPAACELIFDAFREHGTWQVPALAVERNIPVSTLARDPRMRFMPPSLIDFWFDGELEEHAAAEPPTDTTPALPEEIRLTRALHAAGVRILAGTDAGVPPSLPGWSLHAELELLVAAGLDPAEALTAATRGPAEFLGIADRTGTIEPGKRADLVLLRGDPLEDIRNTRTVEAVILDGELLDRDALEGLLEDVAAAAVAARTARTGR